MLFWVNTRLFGLDVKTMIFSMFQFIFLGRLAMLCNNKKTQVVTNKHDMNAITNRPTSKVDRISIVNKSGVLITTVDKKKSSNKKSYSIAYYFVLAWARIYMHKVNKISCCNISGTYSIYGCFG